ncbi:hypothetical protein CONLIGDRAFT_567954 [Coniochaeta ligniaria NRRL 30616]|uniref:C2H2-type domain-containing protein n=1 Tax=Coniochaeta ligniaria NRRL 30616 TaxID=1408157 RepID=A0A1J7K543_9PEZI|nr:hypothetical protein CONLIGDRAFT_567954 [Coniochaeta ligniaria NRRL 30616]
MASEQSSIATASPLAPPSALPTSAHSPVGASEVSASDPTRLRSLKRGRETTPTSPGSTAAPGDLSPSKIARLVTFAQSPLPAPLTGAAALEDERRRREEDHQRLHPPGVSQNPTQKVLSELISGANVSMSRPQDGPTERAPSVTEAEVASRVLQPDNTNDMSNLTSTEVKATSPQSAASAAVTMGSGHDRVMDSPTAMDVDSRNDRLSAPQPEAQMEERTAPTSFSYPGILPPAAQMPVPPPPPRGLSLPMPPSQNTEPRSPSSKKHKCPYCETEFTRHHNLKSHLLTHSQEKPYLCQQCNMRFRRLHDLKRHSKLHTGEKPHICPKCDRKFARADALARHSKGAGGCAGRRSSMGSFAGDDDYDGTDADDSAMTGIIYDASAEGDMTEEERRRLSLPSIKAQHVAAQAAITDGYAAHSRSTYPPAGPRPVSGLLPPNLGRGTPSAETSPTVPNSTASGHTPNTSVSSMPMSAGSSMFSQAGMTESPKPLSPGIGHPPPPGQDKNQRSASLQQQIASRQSEQHAPSGLSAPPHGMSDAAQLAWLSQYPPADASKPKGASQLASSGIPTTTAQQAPAGSGADNANNLFASGEQGLWTYIHTLEDKVKSLGEELASVKKVESQLLDKVVEFERKESTLSNEVALLRQQLGARAEGLPTQS